MPGARAELTREGTQLMEPRAPQLLPETRIRVNLTAEDGTHGQRATLRYAAVLSLLCACGPKPPNRLYSGMPSQDAQPDTTKYAYPAYWAANFTRRAAPRLHLHRCAC